MATPIQSDQKMQKHTSQLSALISPPDEILDDFNHPTSPTGIAFATPGRMIQSLSDVREPLSPTSPSVPLQQLTTRFQSYVPPSIKVVNQDPILYPGQRGSIDLKPLFDDDQYQSHFGAKLQSPLPLSRTQTLPIPLTKGDSLRSSPETETTSLTSGNEEQTEEERRKEAVIDDHYFNYFLPANSVRSKSKPSKWSKPRNFTPPTREEYRLMISFTDTIMRDINTDPKAFIKRARQEQEELYRPAKQQRTNLGYATVLLPKDDKFLHKVKSTPTQSAPRIRKPVKKHVDSDGTPQPEKHKRTVIKKPKQYFNYDDLPDYTPSNDTIPSDKSFRVTWAGQPLDLSNDPNYHLLHPAEVQLASKLRFPCDQYLKTKRRVFIGRVNNLIKYPHKQFCKTDAQQVGGVDVNKLSQLWEAYNSIGWFKDHHFREHVATVKNAALVYDPKNCKWVDNKDFFA